MLNQTFERIIRTENVTVLSRDPYVLLINDLFTDEEADHAQLEFSGGWTRSHVGPSKVDSSIRTSEQQWCLKECEDKPSIDVLVQRIETLLGVPRRRYEHMQVLHYKPGQQYKLHNDFMPESVIQPSGPRVMTLLMYLNDVHEGGATVFPELNISFAPHKGSALLWPSGYDHDPLVMNERSDHLGQPPVGSSVKQVMTFWVHQFDFRKYMDQRCMDPVRPWSSFYEQWNRSLRIE